MPRMPYERMTPDQRMLDVLTIAVFNIISALSDADTIWPEHKKMLDMIEGQLREMRDLWRNTMPADPAQPA